MREYINRHIVANTIRMARAQFVGSFLNGKRLMSLM